MLKNKNYEWMMDYREPDFPFDFMRNLYWMYMYTKIRRDGTVDDVYELTKRYNEAVQNYNVNVVGINNIHRFVCKTFIDKVRSDCWADDSRRELEERIAECDRQLKAPRIWRGLNMTALADELKVTEARLNAEGEDDPRRVTTQWVKEPWMLWKCAAQPDIADLDRNGKCFKSLFIDVDVHAWSDEGKLTVSKGRVIIDLFDKYNGIYCAIVGCDANPEIPSKGIYAGTLVTADTLTGDNGLLNRVEDAARTEIIRAESGNWDFGKKVEKPQVQVAKIKTAKAPNIDKVKKALGVVDDICGDDLNGDIF